MQSFDCDSLPDYLRSNGWLSPDEQVAVRWLTGGVSNAVFLVESNSGRSFVVKQAREQLQVADPWFCSVDRIWREVAVLRCYGKVLGKNAQAAGVQLSVPEVLFEDAEEFLYGMSAAPAGAPTWKEQLLAGKVQLSMATAAGALLGRLHAGTWQRNDLAEEFAEQRFFDDLRLDPYYRHVGRMQPELQPVLDRLIDSLASHPMAVVHGDFSPKNLLAADDSLTLLDFEVGHFGDPAFDLGFFFTHLVLKWLWSHRQELYWQNLVAAWDAYAAILTPTIGGEAWRSLAQRGIRNLGGCLLARVDGKSKVDYLSQETQATVRKLGRRLLLEDWDDGLPRSVLAAIS